MRIAYLINTYPSRSHSFIRREIQALERRGFEVQRFALRGNRNGLVDEGDRAEHERTAHVLAQGSKRLAAAALSQTLRAPRRTLAALRLAMQVARGSDGGIAYHLAYLVEAGYVAARCRALGIEHLHAHFGTNSATVAVLVAALGGPAYSFTVHGPEEFDRSRAGLTRRACRPKRRTRS